MGKYRAIENCGQLLYDELLNIFLPKLYRTEEHQKPKRIVLSGSGDLVLEMGREQISEIRAEQDVRRLTKQVNSITCRLLIPLFFPHKMKLAPTQKWGEPKFICLSFALHNSKEYQGIPDIFGRLMISLKLGTVNIPLVSPAILSLTSGNSLSLKALLCSMCLDSLAPNKSAQFQGPVQNTGFEHPLIFRETWVWVQMQMAQAYRLTVSIKKKESAQ